jgi:hypothetical protein
MQIYFENIFSSDKRCLIGASISELRLMDNSGYYKYKIRELRNGLWRSCKVRTPFPFYSRNGCLKITTYYQELYAEFGKVEFKINCPRGLIINWYESMFSRQIRATNQSFQTVAKYNYS